MVSVGRETISCVLECFETRHGEMIDLRNTGELDLDNTSERICFLKTLSVAPILKTN